MKVFNFLAVQSLAYDFQPAGEDSLYLLESERYRNALRKLESYSSNHPQASESSKLI